MEEGAVVAAATELDADDGLQIEAAFYLDTATGREQVFHADELSSVKSETVSALRRNHTLQCAYCGQRVVLTFPSAGKVRPHFKHAKGYERGLCVSNLTTEALSAQRARRYAGAREGPEHRHAVARIVHYLGMTTGCGPIQTEARLAQGEDCRRPDILFQLGEHRIAIEVQISYEYPAVMAERARFYAAAGIRLIYVWSPVSAAHITAIDDAALNRGWQFLWDHVSEARSSALRQLALSWRWQDHSAPRAELQQRPSVRGVTPLRLLIPTAGSPLNPSPSLRPPCSSLARAVELTAKSDWESLPERFRKWHENAVRLHGYPSIRPESKPSGLIDDLCRLDVLFGLKFKRWTSAEAAAFGAVSINSAAHSGAYVTLTLALAMADAKYLVLTKKQMACMRTAAERFLPRAKTLPGDMALFRAHLARLYQPLADNLNLLSALPVAPVTPDGAPPSAVKTYLRRNHAEKEETLQRTDG